MNDQLKQILSEGIYGKPELKPEEKALFLSNFAERVVIALTRSQVRKKGVYQQMSDAMKKHSQARLYINGTMNYSFYSDYIKLANQNRVPFTIVNDSKSSPIGALLAEDHATKKKPEFIEDDLYRDDIPNPS